MSTTLSLSVRGIRSNNSVDSCLAAEPYFRDCLYQINTGQFRSQSEIDIYYSESKIPLLMRKRNEADSAVTLQPVIVTGPNGTEELDVLHVVAVSPDTHVTRTKSKLMGTWFLTALRVQGPLVIHPERRSEGLVIEEFRAVSEAALSILGIEPVVSV